MKERANLPIIRENRELLESHRDWPGAEGKHLPKCPCHVDDRCEPSVCRLQEFECVRCKQWRPFCFGHSEGNECIACAEDIEKKIMEYVRSSKRGYRRESRIKYFLVGTNDVVGGHDVEPTLNYERIDDILFQMILDKKLEWMEDKETVARGDEDLRYQIPTNGDADAKE